MGYYQNIAELIYFLANIQINNIRFSIKTIVLAGILLFASFSNISEAATGVCLTCNGTPTAISQINTMTREILGAIQTVGTEAPYAGKPVSPVRFEDGKFDPPKATLFSKTLRWARQSFGSFLAVGRIFVNINKYGALDTINSKAILIKGKIYKRDRNKLEDVGQEIANKKFALSVGGGRNETIRSQTFKRMENTINKYKDANLISKDSALTPGITYGQMLGILENLNSLTKNQVIRPSSNLLGNDIGNHGFLLKIKDTAIVSISEAYKCVAEQKCEGTRTQFISDLKSIREMTKSGISKNLKSFEDSTKRLGNGFGINKNLKSVKEDERKAAELGISTEEYKALKMRFGLNAKQIKEGGALGFMLDKRRSQRQSIQKGFTSLYSNGEEETKNKEKVKESDLITTNPQEKSFKLVMATSVNDILAEAQEQYNYVFVAQNADVLTRFGVLSQQIMELEKMVGSKKSGIIADLGNACKNQCSNITSKKCFY